MNILISSRGVFFTEEAKKAMEDARDMFIGKDVKVIVSFTAYPDRSCVLAIGGDSNPSPNALADNLDGLEFYWYADSDGFSLIGTKIIDRGGQFGLVLSSTTAEGKQLTPRQ